MKEERKRVREIKLLKKDYDKYERINKKFSLKFDL
jgi:hypothetical protein